MQKPSLARLVLTLVPATENNGSDVAPAVITRTWGAGPDGTDLVNLKVLLDSPVEKWQTSVKLFETEEQARAHGTLGACFWPPRV